eukprot:m.180891 g.180891  ORF g.180891 m.180891 type:complete len:109 (+) comp14659_c0_seq1:92-418(+)
MEGYVCLRDITPTSSSISCMRSAIFMKFVCLKDPQRKAEANSSIPNQLEWLAKHAMVGFVDCCREGYEQLDALAQSFNATLKEFVQEVDQGMCYCFGNRWKCTRHSLP